MAESSERERLKIQKYRLRLWLILTEGDGMQQQRGKNQFDSVLYLKELSKSYTLGYLTVFLCCTVAARQRSCEQG